MTTQTSGNGALREGFGTRAIETSAETQTSAMQAHAQAAIQARFVMAMQRPRSWDNVRVRILAECRRPGFAEVARYRKPIGEGIEGPSIRFAEACARYAGNLGVETVTTFDDTTKRMIHVTAVDYETNSSFSADISVVKRIERKNSKGRTVIGERLNSYGQTVFIVEATDDEILNAQNALVSKATRTLVLRLIPGDIIEEGQAACIETLRNQAAKDPAGERKKLCDAFATLGVMPDDLVRYVGHALDALQPAELVELRQAYATIRDGETTWREIVAQRDGGAAGDEPKKAPSLADKIKAKRTKEKPVTAAEAKAAPEAQAMIADEETGELPHEPTIMREPGED